MGKTFKSFKKPSLENKTFVDVKQNIATNTNNIESLEGYDFMSYVQFNFQNNLIANSLFIDNLDNRLYMSTLIDTIFNVKENYITICNNKDSGTCITSMITGALGDAKALNNFYLLDDSIIPYGAYIKYFIIDDTGREYPIKVNDTNPFVFINPVSSYKIKAKLTMNANRESPILKGIAVLCYDEVVEGTYGLTNPDLSRLTFQETSTTTLIRDRLNDDKLIKIESPTTITTLLYNNSGDLKNVVTEDNDTISINYLNYGSYLNSENITEIMLLSTTTIKKLKNAGDN